MKQLVVVISLALVLGLVLVGCPQPTDGGETSAPPFMPMVDIPQGTYDYKGSEETTVQAFALAETEVTQKQWETVMTEWPGTAGSDVPSDEFGLGDDRPAYWVSWYDAVEFCNALTRDELTEDDVVYTITKGNETDQDTWTVGVDVTKNGYRLPTEIEWEYAAGWEENKERNTYAGTSVDGNDSNKDDLGDYAWYHANNGNSSSDANYGSKDVKTKKPNVLGLYDMSGNVGEWCYDTWSADMSGRVFRGGSWSDISLNVRVIFRSSFAPSDRTGGVGFRVARNAN